MTFSVIMSSAVDDSDSLVRWQCGVRVLRRREDPFGCELILLPFLLNGSPSAPLLRHLQLTPKIKTNPLFSSLGAISTGLDDTAEAD